VVQLSGGQVGIDFDEQEVQVKFDDRLVNYELSDLDDVVLAYAISIHKSQGAEYPAVVVPLLSQHYIMLQRNLLYTAITRAKRLVVLVGSKSAVAIPVRNNKVQHRYTNLGAKLASS
jgi:exodeoxyribonuclease V alpha subunit